MPGDPVSFVLLPAVDAAHGQAVRRSKVRPGPTRGTVRRSPTRRPGRPVGRGGSTWSTSTPRSAAARTATDSRGSRQARRRCRTVGDPLCTGRSSVALATGCAVGQHQHGGAGTARLACRERARDGERVAVGLDVRGTTLSARGPGRVTAGGCSMYWPGPTWTAVPATRCNRRQP